MCYADIINGFYEITESYVLINEFKVYMGNQRIKIKVLKDIKDGSYSYSNSHHCHGTGQARPYKSSNCDKLETELDALQGALSELTAFYNKGDEDINWVKNEDF